MFIHPLNTFPLVNLILLPSLICQLLQLVLPVDTLCYRQLYLGKHGFSLIMFTFIYFFFNFKNVLGHQWLFCWKYLSQICLSVWMLLNYVCLWNWKEDSKILEAHLPITIWFEWFCKLCPISGQPSVKLMQKFKMSLINIDLFNYIY